MDLIHIPPDPLVVGFFSGGILGPILDPKLNFRQGSQALILGASSHAAFGVAIALACEFALRGGLIEWVKPDPIKAQWSVYLFILLAAPYGQQVFIAFYSRYVHPKVNGDLPTASVPYNPKRTIKKLPERIEGDSHDPTNIP